MIRILSSWVLEPKGYHSKHPFLVQILNEEKERRTGHLFSTRSTIHAKINEVFQKDLLVEEELLRRDKGLRMTKEFPEETNILFLARKKPSFDANHQLSLVLLLAMQRNFNMQLDRLVFLSLNKYVFFFFKFIIHL